MLAGLIVGIGIVILAGLLALALKLQGMATPQIMGAIGTIAILGIILATAFAYFNNDSSFNQARPRVPEPISPASLEPVPDIITSSPSPQFLQILSAVYHGPSGGRGSTITAIIDAACVSCGEIHYYALDSADIRVTELSEVFDNDIHGEARSIQLVGPLGAASELRGLHLVAVQASTACLREVAPRTIAAAIPNLPSSCASDDRPVS